MVKITQVKKRDGRIVDFKPEKIEKAIKKALIASKQGNGEISKELTKEVIDLLQKRFENKIPSVEDIQDIVEEVLILADYPKAAKAYILYREQHRRIREIKKSNEEAVEMVDQYLQESDWEVRENSNMAYSLQGLNNYVTSAVIKRYWLNKIYPPEIRKSNESGDFHIHDLQVLGPYCVGWDLYDLLLRGFGGVFGKIESKPPKHLSAALGQIVNFFYTLQGEAAGAVALSSFDTLLSPFIYYDQLSYPQVKQEIQEFLFNCNVPTRVGFQCVSEDTEILTPEGWKNYEEIQIGDTIKTFNLKSNQIENQKVTSVFKKHYKGTMYRLQNRIQDQLISPKHRVVRKKFQQGGYILEPIEEVCKLKSPFIIPIAGKNNNKEADISDEQIKLMAWIISEGTIEKPTKNRCCYRVSIYQSKEKNRENYNEIIKLLRHFNLNYSEYQTSALGDNVCRIRLDAESSKKIHQWFGTKENVHFIPASLLNLNEKQSKLFLETYLKADGFEGCKISTTDLELLDGLQIIIVNCGYGFTVLKRKPTIGKKDIYVLRIIKHQETYIQKVEKVNYKGIIWCPHTKNETIVARRKGKVFITGNTPFTNLTLDLKVPEHYKSQPVLVGGKFQDKTYGEFQEEVNMINRALAEVMIEGDAKGRPFTFPIPTYNITRDFDWKNSAYEPIWKMTAKYGIPYFANFINSDMKPEDVRSMCCRLRLSNKELYKRGGGLFGSNPLTGSLGVVTINLPRVAYLSKTQKEFFEKLSEVMDLAKDSLEIKRKTLENLTEKGLYPYSRHYLDSIKKMRGKYWANHFSTIGLVGMNEALLNFKQTKTNIGTKTGQEFAQKVLDFMRDRIVMYQEEDGGLYNLEATPAEGSLDPKEKILISQSDPKLTEIGPLIDKYLEKNKKNIQFIGNSEVLKIPEGEMFTYGFNRKNQKIKKYPVTALVRHLAHSMYEINTISGRKVKVTGQHSVFTLNSKGETEEVLVRNLKEKDLIAIPKKIEMEEVNQELNLIDIFKKASFKDKLYLVFPLNFIEKLILNPAVKEWVLEYYNLQWKDVKYFWKKNRVVPLSLIYDLGFNIKREVLESSKIFYRDTKNTKPINVLISLNRAFGFVLGCLLAEGWVSERSEFINTDKNLVQRFILGAEEVFGKGSVCFSSFKREKDKRKTRYTAVLSKIIGCLFEAIDFQGKSNTKKIPAFIFFSSKDCVAGVLEGFHLGDGYIYQNRKKNDYSVRLYTNSKELIEGLNLCLLKLGILAKIRQDKKSKYNSSWKDNYILSITGADNLKKYLDLVLRKKLTLENLHSSRETIFEAPKLIKSVMEKHSLNPSQVGFSKDSFNRNLRNNKISLQYLKKIADKLSALVNDKVVSQLQVLINSNLYWDKIVKIRKIDTPQYVYDLEVDVPGDQVNNFLGGEGLVCLHNTSYRLALKDKQRYPDIITAGTEEKPYYTNSSQLPVNFTDDLFEALKLQDNLQTKYTGGTSFHAFLGEQISDFDQVPRMIKRVFENFRLPYFTLTPTFSICPVHGYISGEHFICPKCVIEQPCEVYSRIVGYLRPVQQWNEGKKQEFKERKEFKM